MTVSDGILTTKVTAEEVHRMVITHWRLHTHRRIIV